jgi:CheW-like domain
LIADATGDNATQWLRRLRLRSFIQRRRKNEGPREEENIVIGALVDSVEEVFELEPEAIEAPPKIGIQLRTDFINGMGKKDDSFIIILDIDQIFSSEELALAKVAEGKEHTQKGRQRVVLGAKLTRERQHSAEHWQGQVCRRNYWGSAPPPPALPAEPPPSASLY